MTIGLNCTNITPEVLNALFTKEWEETLLRLPTAVILLGPSAVGKTKLTEDFVENKYHPIILSKEWDKKMEDDADFRAEYGHCMTEREKGKPFPDDGVIRVFTDTIYGIEIGTNVVLDGCVRTSIQAITVIDILRTLHYQMKFIHLQCSISTCHERMGNRTSERGALSLESRADDIDPLAKDSKLDFYFKNIDSILRYIRGERLEVFEVDAEPPLVEVRAEVAQIFNPQRRFSSFPRDFSGVVCDV